MARRGYSSRPDRYRGDAVSDRRRAVTCAGETLRVLFVNHTSEYSGAEIAMLRLLDCLPEDVQAAVACPPEGRLVEALEEHGVEHIAIPGSDVSFRLHPATTAPGLVAMCRSMFALKNVSRRWGADVVHANSVRAAIIAIGAKRLGGPPVVAQVHDHLPVNALGRSVRRFVARGADRVIAVSDWTARHFNRGLRRPVAHRIYIGIDHERFAPDPHTRESVRRELQLPADAPVLGQVAQITPWKGQLVAVEAFAHIRRRHPSAHLLIVGAVAFAKASSRYDNHGYMRQLRARVDELGLDGCVHFLGGRGDIPDIMNALDLLLLPSWEEPFGTVVAEAMAVGTVPLVGSAGGVTELVADGETGHVLPVNDVMAWASTASELLDQPRRLAEMSRRAESRAGAFTGQAYARNCVDIYRQVLGRAEPLPAAAGTPVKADA